MEIKTKKIDANTILHVDSLTNDPIAITNIDSRYSKKKYLTSWHPDARMMHPSTNDLTNTNFKSADSMNDAMNIVSNAYSNVMDDKIRDPMKVVHAGTSTKTINEVPIEYDDFHLHSDKGDHIATLHVNKKLTSSIGSNPRAFIASYVSPKTISYLTFHGEQPKPEKFEISVKKHPGISEPIAMMHQVKHWLDNKDVQPSFIGHISHPGFKSYKTTLSPEDASKKYHDHLISKVEFIKHKFDKVTPTMFTASKEPEREYDSASHHIIDTSTPGIVKHYSVNMHHPKSYEVKPLQEVIE